MTEEKPKGIPKKSSSTPRKKTVRKPTKKMNPKILIGAGGGILILSVILFFVMSGKNNNKKEPEGFQGKISYVVTIEGMDELKDILKMFSAKMPEQVEYLFWDKNFRAKSGKKSGKPINDVLIKQGEGYLIKHDKKEVYKASSELLQEKRNSSCQVKPLEETLEILGYSCKKYEVEVTQENKTKKLQLWASEQFSATFPKGADILLGSDAIYFKEISGMPLKIVSEIPLPGGKKGAVVITAENISLTIDEGDLDYPSEYKEKDYRSLEIDLHEIQVIGALRNMSTAQAQFQNAAPKDRDQDTIGEYGYLVELSGVVPTLLGDKQNQPLSAPFIDKMLGESASQNGGIATRFGYHFLMYLPAEKMAIPENGKVGIASQNASEMNAQETRWICYAWPEKKGISGNRCFLVSQNAEVLSSKDADYNGMEKKPTPEAAFVKSGNLESAKNLEGELSNKTESFSGFTWEPSS
ncbi:MAG: hypothetical protein AABZ60_11915 [Planctomycetota bacterium]